MRIAKQKRDDKKDKKDKSSAKHYNDPLQGQILVSLSLFVFAVHVVGYRFSTVADLHYACAAHARVVAATGARHCITRLQQRRLYSIH